MVRFFAVPFQIVRLWQIVSVGVLAGKVKNAAFLDLIVANGAAESNVSGAKKRNCGLSASGGRGQ